MNIVYVYAVAALLSTIVHACSLATDFVWLVWQWSDVCMKSKSVHTCSVKEPKNEHRKKNKS